MILEGKVSRFILNALSLSGVKGFRLSLKKFKK